MTDPVPSKDLTTLDDLKRAIEFVPPHPGDCIPGQNIERWLALVHEHRRWAVEAWRTAFEWRSKFPPVGLGYAATNWDEYDEGMALIREKLR